VFPSPRRCEADAQARIGARGGAKRHRGDTVHASGRAGPPFAAGVMPSTKVILAREGSAWLSTPDSIGGIKSS
jgi:hypothetical protein